VEFLCVPRMYVMRDRMRCRSDFRIGILVPEKSRVFLDNEYHWKACDFAMAETIAIVYFF
jgi:hypothetical protein